MLSKKINRLLSKGMLNIYSKVTIESNLRFSRFKKDIEFENFLLQLKNQTSGRKTVCAFSIILVFKGVMTF